MGQRAWIFPSLSRTGQALAVLGVPSEKTIFRLIDAREAWLAVILMDDLRVQSIGLFRRTE